MLRHLRTLAEKGHTVFFSSHTLSEVERLCDRVAIVREGRLVADETLDTLRARARRRFTIRWAQAKDATDVAPPPFLAVDERRNHTWDGSLTGQAPELVRWAATQPIEDLTIGHPDLDSLFRRYYTGGGPEADAP